MVTLILNAGHNQLIPYIWDGTIKSSVPANYFTSSTSTVTLNYSGSTLSNVGTLALGNSSSINLVGGTGSNLMGGTVSILPLGISGSAPVDITLDETQTEPLRIGGVVGRFSSASLSMNQVFTYSLVPGEGDSDNGLFKIDGNRLIAVGSLTKESHPVVSIRVRSTNSAGRFFEKNLTFEGTSEPNQPPNSTMIDSDDRPLHNRQSPFDVDQNGTVTPLDALLVVNTISRNRRPIDARSPLADSTMKVDVNGDLQVSAIDALLVINEISRRAAIAAPQAEGESAVDAVFGSSGDLEEVTAKRKRQASGK